jgi:hypothetical protein
MRLRVIETDVVFRVQCASVNQKIKGFQPKHRLSQRGLVYTKYRKSTEQRQETVDIVEFAMNFCSRNN